MGVGPHLDDVLMGHARVCIQTARDHLFWERGSAGGKEPGSGLRIRVGVGVSGPRPPVQHTHWSALEQLVFGKVLPEKTMRLSPPMGQAACTSATDS